MATTSGRIPGKRTTDAVSVVVAGPGTGKTFCLDSIRDAWGSYVNLRGVRALYKALQRGEAVGLLQGFHRRV